ncbi:MFS transporter [Natroniella sulfidigena]|uniref:MFS transporter n=1 Tax=Natroniella sulfidigena TaxID=723921 RepID=UPI00200A1FE0|nr:MFS transporter [Natroniella sulfidigena]MCK8818171.1 MFS transporter [Natroniella sulfidigena]
MDFIAKEKRNLPKIIQIIYGIGVSYAIVDQIFAQWVLYYYLPPAASDLEALLPPILIALALVISRFVDMIIDPLVGYWSDRFESKWGRRIPFITVGAVPLILLTVAFFYPIKSDGGIPTFIYLTLVGSFFFIFYTIVGAPYNSLIPEISQSRKDRLNLSTWQSVFRLFYTAIAMIAPGILIEQLGRGNDEQGIRLMVILLGSLALIGMLIMVFSLDERKYSGGKVSDVDLKSSLKLVFSNRSFIFYLLGFMFFFLGFNILRASINYYVEEIMGYGKGMITVVSALLFGAAAISFYPINRLARRIGYKKPMLVSLVALILLSGALFLLGRGLPVEFGFLIFTLIGIPVAGAAFIFPPAMLSEISAVMAEEEEVQIEGLLFGIQGFFLKLAFLLSIAILPLVLVAGTDVSILKSLITTPQGVQQWGISLTSLWAAAFFLISTVFYYFYQEQEAE